MMRTRMIVIGLVLLTGIVSAKSAATPANGPVHISTDYIDAYISLDYPGFKGLSVDSLGKEHFPLVAMKPPAKPWRPVKAECKGSRVEYRSPNAAPSESPRWAIEIETNKILLQSHWSADDVPHPLVLNADTRVSHVTLLGLMDTNDSVRLPALIHFPGQGTFRVSADLEHADPLGYATTRMNSKIIFPAATREHPSLTYCLKAVCIHPKIPGIAGDERFDGFRRNWLNIFQLNPQRRMLANNAGSTSCAFCYYEYGDIALRTPPLAEGLTALDLVRQTLDAILGGAKAYGLAAPGNFPADSSDTLPSLIIAADDCVRGGSSDRWLAANYAPIKGWADKMLATDTNGNGLVKYVISGNSGIWPKGWPKVRPANWWDTIGFGYEDAYGNALAYRALGCMAHLARRLGKSEDAVHYRTAADKLKAAYFRTFYDPKTGILAGWRSADGQLHDYYFLFVNGIAIDYGLVPKDKANAIMDKLLAKMNEVGYTNFALGLPGNLIPVPPKDYVHHSLRYGGGTKADGSDGFQIYENGGATACFAYYTLAALYDLGRIQDGDRMLFPMLESFAKGDFQGWGPDGMSKDWKTWDGQCHGYEGFLSDNYYALLAVLDREAALKKKAADSSQRSSQPTRATTDLQNRKRVQQ